MGRATPYKLAPFTLTVLDVDVPTRVLEAAISERAIDENALVKNKMLILKDLPIISIHKGSPVPLPHRLLGSPTPRKAAELPLGY